MNQDLINAIANFYGIEIVKIIPGPTQFVATTYIIDDIKGTRFFCKIIDKPLMIPGIIDTLPAVEEMAKQGIEKICFPIRSTKGLYFFYQQTLVVLFNYIDASRGLEYHVDELGKQIALVHAITPKMTILPPKEAFIFSHFESYIALFEQALVTSSPDPVIRELKKTLQVYEQEIRQYIDEFQKVCTQCANTIEDWVITHGDLATNILLKTPTDIAIIDWDEMRLAPRERDLWMKDHEPAFLAGYRSIIPDFQINPLHRRFFILQYYFERMHFYFVEVNDIQKNIDERYSLLERLSQNRMAGRNLIKLQEGQVSI